jgi:hypothetical protein
LFNEKVEINFLDDKTLWNFTESSFFGEKYNEDIIRKLGDDLFELKEKVTLGITA